MLQNTDSAKAYSIENRFPTTHPKVVDIKQKQGCSTKAENHSPPMSDKSSPRTQENSQVKMERIAQAMDSYLQSTQRDLEIQVHDRTGDLMVKVISKEDGEVIREIPSEEILNLASKVEEMVGILINENA